MSASLELMMAPTPEFLLIDAGNTRLKWVTAGKRWPTRITGDIATKEATTAWIRSLAKKYPSQPVVIASVVPKLLPAFRRAFGGRLLEVNARQIELGLKFHYPKPAEIGADRLAAAVAAYSWGFFPAIIIACGTATAFTVLDAKGRLYGGAIAPGLQAQLTALIGSTAQLPSTTLRPVRNALGRSTQDAIRAGVMLNFQGGVKEIIQQLTKALPGKRKPHILLTGGNARFLQGVLDEPVTLRPLLVFEGLLMIGSRLFMPIP